LSLYPSSWRDTLRCAGFLLAPPLRSLLRRQRCTPAITNATTSSHCHPVTARVRLMWGKGNGGAGVLPTLLRGTVGRGPGGSVAAPRRQTMAGTTAAAAVATVAAAVMVTACAKPLLRQRRRQRRRAAADYLALVVVAHGGGGGQRRRTFDRDRCATHVLPMACTHCVSHVKSSTVAPCTALRHTACPRHVRCA
jgi:hypothetical protein